MTPTKLNAATLCLATVVLGTIMPLRAEPAAEPRAEMVDYGIYEPKAQRMTRKDTSTTAGYSSSLKKSSDLALVKQTQDVPLTKGIVFGYRVRLHGISNAEVIPLEMHYKHPPIRRHDGKLSTGFMLRNRHPVAVDGIYETGVLYRLSEDYELVPGLWTFELMHQDKVLVSKTLKVHE